MSLIHDPSAIRYASTQEAYGQLWTLDKVEPDGAQVWKNAKGQTAMVQAEPEGGGQWYIQGQVYQDVVIDLPVSIPPLDWVFDGKDDTIDIPLDLVKRAIYCSPVDLAIRARQANRAQINDLTDPTNEQTTASGRAGKYAKTLEDCKQAMQSGRVSSTEENSSNSPKGQTIFGYYSQEAVLAGCAVFTYLDENNAVHLLTRYEPYRADKCRWSDCQFVGEFPIGNYIETIKQPTLAGQQVWWKNLPVESTGNPYANIEE